MGIPVGITLIVGGGFHGKSTLLEALEIGVYNHIAQDGREFVITRADGMKIRAEDGRSVEKVNITPFIDNLPGKRTRHISLRRTQVVVRPKQRIRWKRSKRVHHYPY